MFTGSTTRRNFLLRAGLTGVGAVLVLAGCGGGEQEQSAASATTDESDATAHAATGGDPCDDLSGLKPEEVQLRKTFNYRQPSEDPATECHVCEFYKAPAEGDHCGGCTLFPGPVSPEGVCDSFSEA